MYIQCRVYSVPGERCYFCHFVLCNQVEKNHILNAKVKLDRKLEYGCEREHELNRIKKHILLIFVVEI